MNANAWDRRADWLLAALAALTMAAQLALLARGEDFLVGKLTNDDTFYYLQTVWNTKALGWVTFDGLHRTNGVQLLWFWILYAVSWFATTKSAFLVLSLLTAMLFNAACYVPIRLLGRRLGSPVLTVVAASLWTLQLFWGVYWLGLENAIHAPLLWWIAAEIARLLARPPGADWSLRPLGLLLLATVWTRLDGVVIGAPVFAVTALLVLRQDGWRAASVARALRQVAGLAAAGAIAGLAYAGVSYAMGGSAIPVSAIVKTGQPVAPGGLVSDLLLKIGCDFPPLLPFRFQTSTVSAVVAATGLLAMLLLARGSRNAGLRAGVWIAAALGAGLLLYHAVVLVLHAQYAPYCNWHRSPMFVFWVLVLSLALTFAWDLLESRAPHLSRARFWLFLALAAVTVVLCARRLRQTWTFPYEQHTWHQRYRLAKWVDANLPPDAILGAWNAGEMGYFSGRRVINLDGLINDVDYARRIVLGGESLVDYLRTNRVSYLVDYYDGIPVRNDLDVATLPVVHTLDRGGGYPLTVWKFDPEARP